MNISPEMARAELMRRRSSKGEGSQSSITPQMAIAELERRKSFKEEKPQEESTLQKLGRGFARGARDIALGPLDVADFLATPVREGLNVGARALGMKQIPTLGGEVEKGIDTLTGGYATPQTPGEKTQSAVQRAIASMPAGLGLGAAAQGAKNVPNLVALGKFLKGSNVMTPTNIAATGAASGLTQEALNVNPEDVVGAMGAGIAGGTAVPAAAGLLSTLTGKGRQAAGARLGEFFKVNPHAVETFEKAGITPTLADVSEGKIPKMLTHRIENIPLAGHHIREAKELQKSQVLEGLGQGEFGKILSKGEAGELATKGAKSYQKSREADFSKKFKKVEEDIGKLKDDSVGIEGTNKFFENILKNVKTESQVERFKKSPIGKLYTDLYEAAKKNNGRLPYHDAKERLDEINDLITTHGLIGKVSQGKLKKFASVYSKDIENSLEPKFKELGKDSYKNWKDVKKSYSSYAEEEIPKLNEIYKRDKKSGTDAFIDLMTSHKKGGEKPALVLKGLSPEDQVELTDAVHKQLGRNKDGSFSPLKWSREFKGLEPESQKVLLSPLNESSKKRLNYISDSMDHLKSTLEEANTSKSGYYVALDKVLNQIPIAIGGLAATGNPLSAMTLGGGLLLSKITASQVLTNPKFINWMYKGMKAKNLDHFKRNLERVPHVGKFTRSLKNSVQTFQHDLEKEQKNQEK